MQFLNDLDLHYFYFCRMTTTMMMMKKKKVLLDPSRVSAYFAVTPLDSVSLNIFCFDSN